MFSRLASSLAAALITILVFVTGALEFVERPLMEQRFKLSQRDADSGFVIVEIDPKSLRQIGTWPWKRSLHALLIDRLTAADAGTIVFDVDFSLASSEAEDAALENALARRSGRTVLAAFRQWSESEGVFVDVGPLPRFAQHSEIAAANVFPENDGLIWRLPAAQAWNGSVIPSIPSSVARLPQTAVDTGDPVGNLWIDYGIRPGSIQRYSFSDVAGGVVDPALLTGKTILVGATAVELGDNVATPLHRSLPGVFVQMLAAQSLIQGRALQPVPIFLTIVLLLGMTTGVAFLTWRLRPDKAFAANMALDVVAFVTALVIQSQLGLLLPVAPLIVGAFLTGTFIVLIRFRELGLKVVAERLARLRSQAMMANVAENAFDALITIDKNCEISSINNAAVRIFRVSRAKSSGLKMDAFYIPSKLTGCADFEQVLEQAALSGYPMHILCRRTTGRAFHADMAVTRLEEEHGGGLILLMRDIDRRVKAEKRARRRERELKAAKQKAELANRAKTEFLANMSHELKTPLNAVMGFAEVMQNELFGPLGSPNYVEYSKDIYDGGARLLATVTDVLDFARIEDGKLELREEEIDLGDLMARLGSLSRERAEEAGLSLTIEPPEENIFFVADERLMKQALGSILSNAIKFNKEEGQVTLSLSVGDNGDALLSVSDSGIGIPAEQIETCLKAFGQADSSLQRTYEGSGLGLTLAKAYVEGHGGALSIESALDEGTTVTISLPAERRYLPKLSKTA
ncbi:CHASE2 domain-containing protein [Pelagibius sp. Alg239-R121]|uniref:CHASE2 domain-containing protein n=1 Tax=Pelagibius sp. Alg239-R121 TaxID=2993448 RepID=UPI0024A774AA|nr:CHASE2 domain-containing protein [Pelagibius sp. Alg239-R121]